MSEKLYDTFKDEYRYGILYIDWDGLRILIFKTEEEMNNKYQIYKFIKSFISMLKELK